MTKLIVSYDGTANENDAIALGSLFARAGAEVSLGYVRHTNEAVSDAEAQEVLDRGAAIFDGTFASQPRRDRPLDAAGPERAGRADRRAGDRLLLGLAHRSGPHHDRQLRPATARGRPGRGRDRSGRAWPALAAKPGVQRIVAVGEAGGDGSAQATAQALAGALGAEVVPVADESADLLVIDSRKDAADGRVSISSSAAHLIEIATCPVLVVPARRRAVLRPSGRSERLANRSSTRSRE